MSVQTTLLEADKAVRTALENQGLYFIVLLIVVAAVILAIVYMAERWSWRPRRKPLRGFRESEKLTVEYPVPTDLGYDPRNPINGKWTPEESDGVVWYRVS